MNKILQIGDNVTIKANGVKAFIHQILMGFDGIQYQISYWDDNIRRSEWVFYFEIEKIEKPKGKVSHENTVH